MPLNGPVLPSKPFLLGSLSAGRLREFSSDKQPEEPEVGGGPLRKHRRVVCPSHATRTQSFNATAARRTHENSGWQLMRRAARDLNIKREIVTRSGELDAFKYPVRRSMSFYIEQMMTERRVSARLRLSGNTFHLDDPSGCHRLQSSEKNSSRVPLLMRNFSFTARVFT